MHSRTEQHPSSDYLMLRIFSAKISVLIIIIVASTAGSYSVSAQTEGSAWVGEDIGRSYVAVIVTRMDVAVDWYSTALGLTVLDRSDADDGSWSIVNLRSELLHVELIRDDRAVTVDRSTGFFKIGFEVGNIDLVASRVEAATGNRPRIVDFEQHGVRILQLRDPDNNIIQITSPIQ